MCLQITQDTVETKTNNLTALYEMLFYKKEVYKVHQSHDKQKTQKMFHDK